MTQYSFHKDILTESYLHYVMLDSNEKEKEGPRDSIVIVIVIIMEMIAGKRLLRLTDDDGDIAVKYLENEDYWFMLKDQQPISKPSQPPFPEIERVLEEQGDLYRLV